VLKTHNNLINPKGIIFMPYRELPKSDAKMLNALTTAKNKAENTPAAELAFSAETLNRLNIMQPLFAQEIQERGAALSVQTHSTAGKTAAQDKLRMCISHFIQVFNFGIERGKYKVTDRPYYQLDVSQTELPSLNSEPDIERWAKNLIRGEQDRKSAGGEGMNNPGIDEVEAAYLDFVAKNTEQSTLKDTFDKEQEDVEKMRGDVMDLIKDIWDEVEFTFRKDSGPSLRRKAREYGVYYAYRQGEVVEDPVEE
jgi:hypothetical protein